MVCTLKMPSLQGLHIIRRWIHGEEWIRKKGWWKRIEKPCVEDPRHRNRIDNLVLFICDRHVQTKTNPAIITGSQDDCLTIIAVRRCPSNQRCPPSPALSLQFAILTERYWSKCSSQIPGGAYCICAPSQMRIFLGYWVAFRPESPHVATCGALAEVVQSVVRPGDQVETYAGGGLGLFLRLLYVWLLAWQCLDASLMVLDCMTEAHQYHQFRYREGSVFE